MKVKVTLHLELSDKLVKKLASYPCLLGTETELALYELALILEHKELPFGIKTMMVDDPEEEL